ncbi:MAG: hypothetical protein E6575_23995, partial [Bradyrhizobium sp.]|nr:hypothetical protein [Bradyrhizobium sp.]
PPLSSSAKAKADDPVRRDVSVRSLLPRHTGCSAFAEHDSVADDESSNQHGPSDSKETLV